METEFRIKEFVPKGGMCRTCKKINEDCSGLNFESMPIIAIDLEEIIVRCTEHERVEIRSQGCD